MTRLPIQTADTAEAQDAASGALDGLDASLWASLLAVFADPAAPIATGESQITAEAGAHPDADAPADGAAASAAATAAASSQHASTDFSSADLFAAADVEAFTSPAADSFAWPGRDSGIGSDDAGGVQPHAGIADYQTSETGADTLTSADGGAPTDAVLFAPETPASTPDFLISLANPEVGSAGLPLTIAGVGGVVANAANLPDGIFSYQAAHVDAAAPASLAPTAVAASAAFSALVDLPGLDNPPAGSFGAAIPDASIGAGGATAAQVQAALDESGLSVNGSGIKVGVLSDSFNDLGGAAADEADGALPPAADIDVIKDLASGGTDEGRAMMQIIHDIAPGASLAFYTAFDSEQDFASGILALAAAGCKVIVDDASYFDEPFFQNGIVAQAIQTVEAEGVTYVTAAGNDAGNGYQAVWTPISGTFDGTKLADAESFGGSLVQTITIGPTSTNDVPLLLEWNQAYGSATADLEMLIFSGGKLLGTITNSGDGEPTNPWVGIDLGGDATYQVAIENLSGPNPGLIKEITEGDGLPVTISGANVGTVYGHAMTPGAITAGAVSSAATPAFGASSPVSESFSSSGAGTELLFANNGTALSSPDVLSPVVVSGVDDINTTVSGNLSDFYGTSAASASLAGVAALLLSANPDLTPAQVEQIMEETALPMANSAVSGAGLVQVDPAVAAAQADMAAVAVSVPNANVPLVAGEIAPVSSLFTATAIPGYSVTEYWLYDNNAVGNFVVDGVVEPNVYAVPITITAAQLAETTFKAGGTLSQLYVSASDGTTWSSWQNIDIAIVPDPGPSVTVPNADVPLVAREIAPVSSLFTATAIPGYSVTEYRLYDNNAVGNFVVNGVVEPNAYGVPIAITAAQLAETTFQAGSTPSQLYVSAWDGTAWGSWQNIDVAIVPDPGPSVTVPNADVPLVAGEIAPVSSLFTATAIPGYSVTEYWLYDNNAVGHFVVNGVVEPNAYGVPIAITAAQLAETTFQAGSTPSQLYVSASDGTAWGSWQNIDVAIVPDPGPSVTVPNVDVSLVAGGAVSLSSLFTATAIPGYSVTEYWLYDNNAVGHFVVNGVVEPNAYGVPIAITAAQLAETTFQAGGGPAQLYVSASDGTAWGSWQNIDVTGTDPPSAFSLQYKGFDYVAFYNGAYENSDSLPSLAQTGANSIEATLDYGIDVQTSQVVADPNYTDSLTALGKTIAQAESLGLSVMVRPLIDFLNPSEIAPYSVGEWRQYYQPTNVAAFFASYKQMIVAEAEVAQQNGAQMLSIGAELDQLTGAQYLPYWTDIINSVRAVFSGALTYSASWNTASEVSFWSQLNYEGIDCYVPLSNAPNPTLQNLVNGWLEPATQSANPGAYAVMGNESPVQYFENLAAQSGKPLLFTELGYANDTGAAADPSASGNSPDPGLQAELYQAFFQAWQQSGSSALVGAYFWEWDPNGSTSNVGPSIDSFSPQNGPAQAQATAGFESVGSSHDESSAAAPTLIDDSAITNAGAVTLTGTVVVDVPRVTLGGAGTVTLADVTIEGSAGGETLDNAGNTIAGTGTIGDGSGHLALDNASGTIEASGGKLLLDTGATIANAGALAAAPGAYLQVDDPVTGPGSATIGSGATLELAAADSQSVTFDASTGTLILDHPSTFGGQIFNFTGNGNLSSSDQIDFKDILFGPGTMTSFSGNSGGGTLTVSDAQHDTAHVLLVGDYENSTFSTFSDGDGGTLVVDPPAAHDAGNAVSQPDPATSGGPANDSFIFKSGFAAAGENAAASSADELEKWSSAHSGNEAPFGGAHAAHLQSLLEAHDGGDGQSMDLNHHHSVTLANIHLTDLH